MERIWQLQGNLRKFGLEDLTVKGKLASGGFTGLMQLSELCCRREANRGVYRKGNSLYLGLIDKQQFYFYAAPDLRSALGWLLATSAVRQELLHCVELDQEVQSIETLLRNAPQGDERLVREFYFGPFEEQVTRSLNPGKAARMWTSNKDALLLLWCVGTCAIYGQSLPYPRGLVAR